MSPNISISKGNQKMKFGKLIEYEKHFLEKSYTTKCGRENIPTAFSKIINLSISLNPIV